MSVIARMKLPTPLVALVLSLALAGGPVPGAGAVASVATARGPVTVGVDTNGRDEVPRELSEREARREIRALEREIRREERLLDGKSRGRGGDGGRGRGRGRSGARANGMAVAGFVLALAFLYIGPVGSVLGIVFGAIGLRRSRREPERYGRREMAKAALIIGIVGLVLYVGYFVAVLSLLAV